MIRWIIFAVLMAGLLASAVGVVVLRHESRQLFSTLQETEMERDRISVEWSRLQLEQAWLAEAGRIEREARDQLDMRRPEQVGILVEGR